jgi:hypothetical protein
MNPHAELPCWQCGVMRDFAFKVNLVAVVQVRAANESVARAVIPTVLGAPGTSEIHLANRTNLELGREAAVMSVEFSIGQIKASKVLQKRARLVALAKSWRRE